VKHVTLLFLLRNDALLLAMKKRGFGAGKWNGAGGKVEPGETPLQAAIRECQEEICVTPTNPRLAGILHFFDLPEVEHYCHIYIATAWDGEPAESEDMRPQWFTFDDIPYETMWVDDHLWLPELIAGKPFKGRVVIESDVIREWELTGLSADELARLDVQARGVQ
jgi:8-oxo-dGTP diphosphatase